MYGSHETLQKRQCLLLTMKIIRSLDGVYEKIKIYLQLYLVCETLLCVSLEKFPIKSQILFKWCGSHLSLPKQSHVLVLQIVIPVYNQKKTSCYSFSKSYGFTQRHIHLQYNKIKIS